MNQRGEISIMSLIQVFILMLVTVFLVQGGQPMINALFYSSPAFADGTFARLLLDLFPLAPILGMFYILFRQAPGPGLWRTQPITI